MTTRKTYHVAHIKGHWQVKLEGASRASVRISTKEEAIATAVEIAKHNLPSSVRIHRLDGTIEDEHTFY
jgi:uncharacterized protein YdaT